MTELEAWDWIPGPAHSEPPVESPYLMFQIKHETPYERRLRMLEQVRRACMACSMCELGRQGVTRDQKLYRDPHVFSNLNPTRFMVVGQNPGWTEVCEQRPFVGEAGANFDAELAVNGLTRTDFYICNTVRCHTNGNQQPLHKHICRCQPFLQIEINLLRPLLVVALGVIAFEALCSNEVSNGIRFGAALGKITKSKLYEVPVFAAYHPSPLNIKDPGRAAAFKNQVRLLCGLVKKLKERHDDAVPSTRMTLD